MTKLISFKLNRSLLIKLDGAAANRSDFIREAVVEKLQRAGPKNQSAWEALKGVAGLDISFPEAPGRVRRVKL